MTLLNSLRKVASLEYLTFVYCGLDSRHFYILLYFMSCKPKLKGIDFSGLKLKDEECEWFLKCIKEKMQNLISLKLNDCHNKVPDSIPTKIIQNCDRIEELELSNMTFIDSDDKVFLSSLFDLKSLTSLKLPNIQSEDEFFSIKHLYNKKFDFEKLDFGFNNDVSNILLEIFSTSTNHLCINDGILDTLGHECIYMKKNQGFNSFSIMKIFNDLIVDSCHSYCLANLKTLNLYHLDNKNEYLQICLKDNQINWTLTINAKYSFENISLFQQAYYYNLKEFRFCNCRLNSDFMDFFINNLQNLCSLETVHLCHNHFTNVDLEKLFDHLNNFENNIKILKIFDQSLSSVSLTNLLLKIRENNSLLMLNSYENCGKIQFTDKFINSRNLNISSADQMYKYIQNIIDSKNFIITNQMTESELIGILTADDAEIEQLIIKSSSIPITNDTNAKFLVDRLKDTQDLTISFRSLDVLRSLILRDLKFKRVKLVTNGISGSLCEDISLFMNSQKQMMEFSIKSKCGKKIALCGDIGIELFKNITSEVCKVENLDLSSCSFSVDMCKYVRQFIGYQKNLKSLNLSNTVLIGDIGKEIFSNGVVECTQIEELNLSQCCFSKEMSENLGEFIRHQKCLKYLDLTGTSLSTEIIFGLFKEDTCECTKVEKLDISLCEIGCNGSDLIGRFINAQKNLKSLYARQINVSNNIGVGIFKHLTSNCSSLIDLNLSGCKFSLEMSEYLGKFIGTQKELEKIDLSSTFLAEKVGRNILENISSECCNLRNINLSSCTVSKSMSESLGKFLGRQHFLEQLNLHNMELNEFNGRDIFKEITRVHGVTKLNVSHCNLATCSSDYWFSDNKLNEGESSNDLQTYFKKFLSNQKNLVKINFSEIRFQKHLTMCLSTKLSFLRELILSNVTIRSDYLTQLLQNQSKLCVLDLNGVVVPSEEVPETFSIECENIEKLILSSLEIAIETAKYFNFLIGIQSLLNELVIKRFRMSENFGKCMLENMSSRCSNIQKLDLSQSDFDADVAVHLGKFIANQTNLLILNLSATDLSGPIAKSLFGNTSCHSKYLNTLILKYCKFCRYEVGFLGTFIGHQIYLENFDLSATDISDEIGINLFTNINQKCSNIKKFDISSCKISENMSYFLGDFIANQAHLMELNLNDIDLSHEIGCRMFKNLSPVCCSIYSLQMNSCKLSTDMISHVKDFIERQNNLESFVCSQAEFIDEICFRDLESCCSNLKELLLNECNYSSETSKLLGQFLSSQQRLEKLSLNDSDLSSDIGIQFFRQITSKVCTLTDLSLSSCVFTNDMSSVLGNFINQQAYLCRLDISDTNLNDGIGHGIFDDISSNCNQLYVLNLSGCLFSVETMKALAKFLGNQLHLNELILSKTNLSSEIGTELFRNIPCTCNKLENLQLRSCILSAEMIKYLRIFLECQGNLKSLDLSYTDLTADIGLRLFECSSDNFFSINALNLSSCRFSEEISEHFCEFIRRQTRQMKIIMDEVETSSKIWTGLFMSPKTNLILVENMSISCDILIETRSTGLNYQYLWLNNLTLTGSKCDSECGKNLFESLSSGCLVLKVLDMSKIMVSDEVAESIGLFLGRQIYLEELNVSNYIGNIEKLCKSIPNIFCNLRALNISDCGCLDKFAGRFIGNQSYLFKLNFAHNELKKPFIEEIINRRQMFSLTNLNVSACTGCLSRQLGILISCQSYLKILNLSSLDFRSTGRDFFCPFEKNCFTLKKLILDKCYLHNHNGQYLATFFKLQKNLEYLSMQRLNLVDLGKEFVYSLNLAKTKVNIEHADLSQVEKDWFEEHSIYAFF